MKRLLLLSVCVVLAGALTAQADGVFGTFTYAPTSESVAVNWARTVMGGSNTGLDLITLTIGTMTNTGTFKVNGVLDSLAPSPVFKGSSASDYLYVYDDESLAGTTVVRTPGVPGSYVNFDGSLGGLTLVPQCERRRPTLLLTAVR